MVKINESKQAQKALDKAPKEIIRSYEIWARLNLKWRVIYQISRSGEVEVINVVRVTAHDYRRK